MTLRGYIKTTDNVAAISHSISLLTSRNVSVENILISAKFSAIINNIHPGDQIVVCELSHICNNILDLLEISENAWSSGFSISSIGEPWFATSNEELIILMRNLYALNLELTTNRSKVQRHKLTSRHKTPGRPVGSTKFSTETIKKAIRLYSHSTLTVKTICQITGLKPRLLYRQLKLQGIELRRSTPNQPQTTFGAETTELLN